MSKVRDAARGLSTFLLGRYPFFNAITLLMFLGERAIRESYPPFDPRAIYCHLFVMMLCAACMSFNKKSQQAALVHAGQLLYMAYTVATNERLKYRAWVQMRMAYRYLGVAACFVYYAFFKESVPRNQQLRRIAEVLLGLYAAFAAYVLVESPEDREAFLTLVPGGMLVYYTFVLLYCVAALCFLPDYFVYDAIQMFAILVTVTTLLIDVDFRYWTRKRGMDFWNQVRLVVDNMAVVTGLVMYLACTRKTVISDRPDSDTIDESEDSKKKAD